MASAAKQWTGPPESVIIYICGSKILLKNRINGMTCCAMRLARIILQTARFTVVSPGKCLAGGLQSGCTANLTGAQYKKRDPRHGGGYGKS